MYVVGLILRQFNDLALYQKAETPLFTRLDTFE
jgi:hypothetical protein